MEVNTLWLFIPGGIFAVWGLVLCVVVAMMNKGMTLMLPEQRKSVLLTKFFMAATAQRYLLFGWTLIFIGLAFS